MVLWCGLNPVLAYLNIAPRAPMANLAGQGALLGVVFYLHLQYPLAAILALHLVDSYVYLGENSFWNWITQTSGRLVTPLRWLPLVIWKIDLAPPLGIALLIGGPVLWERRVCFHRLGFASGLSETYCGLRIGVSESVGESRITA